MTKQTNTSPAGRLGVMLYAAVAYTLFLVVFTAFIFWSLDFLLPRTLDQSSLVVLSQGAVSAILVDIALVILFGLQHSIMARPAFKKWLVKVVPKPAERATYVLFSSLFLALLMVGWQPLPGHLWQLTGSVMVAGYVVNALGWGFLLAATFMVSHFDLFGLRQAWLNLRHREPVSPHFTTRFAYGFIRHPIMTGVLMGLWLVPVMSWGHLLLSLGLSGYVLVGTHFEERDLVRFLGERYRLYRQQVPMFFPRLGRRLPEKKRI